MQFILLLSFGLRIFAAFTEASNGDGDGVSGLDQGDSPMRLPNIPRPPKPVRRPLPGPVECQCERHEIRSRMVPRRLSTAGGGQIRIRRDREPMGKGAYSNIYHAELEGRDPNGRVTFECVALKVTPRDPHGWYLAHEREWEVLEAFGKRVRDAKRRHVIRMLEHGTYSAGRNQWLFSVLEMGSHDYLQHLGAERQKWTSGEAEFDEKTIEAEIREVALAARDMHQLVMHLDLKPMNLLFVPEGGDQVLKAIDFGASELIDATGARQANFCKALDSNYARTTQYYESPEHLAQCRMAKGTRMELSSKSDIWAVGMILHQIILMGPEYDYYDTTQTVNEVEVRVIYVKLEQLKLWLMGEKYRGGRLGWLAVMRKHWADLEWVLRHLLTVRQQYPRISHLIGATLKVDPERRPTARGILAFLGRKCRLESERRGEEGKVEILPGLELRHLRGLLGGLMTGEGLTGAPEEFAEDGELSAISPDQVRHLKALADVADGNEPASTEEGCDTQTNGGGDSGEAEHPTDDGSALSKTAGK